MKDIDLRKFIDGDLEKLKIWLKKEHIKPWFNWESWIYEITQRTTEYSFIRHFIAEVDGVAIGFCQFYDCYIAKEDWYLIDTPNETFSLDFLIGETTYLNQGFGVAVIKAMINLISQISTAKFVIVKPEEGNKISQKTLLSTGFVYDDNMRLFSYKILH